MQSDIEYERLLGNDLYATFKGKFCGKDAVIKVFHEMSDENNEYEFLEFMQDKGVKGFPRPFLKIKVDYEPMTILSVDLEDVYKIIAYEYIEGEHSESISDISVDDIKQQLAEIHRWGFVYGDLHPRNIICTKDGKSCLIDFGRTFSVLDPKFPPMEYMIEDNEIPTQKDDLEILEKLITALILWITEYEATNGSDSAVITGDSNAKPKTPPAAVLAIQFIKTSPHFNAFSSSPTIHYHQCGPCTSYHKSRNSIFILIREKNF